MEPNIENDALPEETAPNSEGVEREMSALRDEIAALKDRSLRALAEVENVRKRLERERDDAKAYSVTRFARDLLNVADNLSRAIAAYPAEKRNDIDDSVRAVLDGVDATERELQAALGRHGVKPIDAAGAKFDPHLHQAIAEVPGSGQAPGTVVTVVQSGYIIGERLLRPAMVTVARAESGASGGQGGHVDTKV